MNINRVLPLLAASAVIAAIVAGLIYTGTPQRQRELRQDEQRRADLGRLSSTLARHYMDTGQLPESLDALVDGRLMTSLPRDPLTDENYEYRVTATAAFELCAEFNHPSEPASARDFFAHTAGRACFDFDYSTLRLD